MKQKLEQKKNKLQKKECKYHLSIVISLMGSKIDILLLVFKF